MGVFWRSMFASIFDARRFLLAGGSGALQLADAAEFLPAGGAAAPSAANKDKNCEKRLVQKQHVCLNSSP